MVSREDRVVSEPPATPLVQIRELSKQFDDVVAVDRVSLDILRSELFAILGSSGCGKTTLLRMLAGFEQPTSGRIVIDGVDVTDAPPYERPVNMMFQSYALFPHMTVAENVAYGLKKERVPRAQIKERVARDARARQARTARGSQAGQAFRRAAAAGGACPRTGQAAEAAAAR